MTNRIYQPQELDLVGDPVLIAGVGSGFEATLQYRVTDGHDEVTGHFTVGGTGMYDAFQLSVDVSGAAFARDQVFVQIFEQSANDGSEINVVNQAALYGPNIVPGYRGYREHEVSSGESLSAIAKQHYGDADLHSRIVRANPTRISDPDRIFPGQILRIPVTG